MHFTTFQNHLFEIFTSCILRTSHDTTFSILKKDFIFAFLLSPFLLTGLVRTNLNSAVIWYDLSRRSSVLKQTKHITQSHCLAIASTLQWSHETVQKKKRSWWFEPSISGEKAAAPQGLTSASEMFVTPKKQKQYSDLLPSRVARGWTKKLELWNNIIYIQEQIVSLCESVLDFVFVHDTV